MAKVCNETVADVPAAQGAIGRRIPVDPPDIRAPRHVIEAELGGGFIWREIVSPDGVRSFQLVQP